MVVLWLVVEGFVVSSLGSNLSVALSIVSIYGRTLSPSFCRRILLYDSLSKFHSLHPDAPPPWNSRFSFFVSFSHLLSLPSLRRLSLLPFSPFSRSLVLGFYRARYPRCRLRFILQLSLIQRIPWQRYYYSSAIPDCYSFLQIFVRNTLQTHESELGRTGNTWW